MAAMSQTVVWIQLDSTNPYFMAGSVLSGQLYLGLAPNQRIRGVYLEVKGEGKVTLWRRRAHGQSSSESYLNHRIWLLGSESGPLEDLAVRENTLHFAIQLPCNLPSSFYGSKGQVHYELVAHILHTLKNVTVRKTFFVVARSDLNAHPRLALGQEDDRTMNYCICRSGYIHVRLSLPRTGLVPGENFQMKIEITNQSSGPISSATIALHQQVYFTTTCHKVKRTSPVVKGALPGELPASGEARVWAEPILEIPPSLAPTNLGKGCTIIDVQYYVKLTVDPGAYNRNLTIKIPIVIGTIPISPFE